MHCKKINFFDGYKTYKSIYAYIVFAFTNNYLTNNVRLCVCSSFDEAVEFINKNFFRRTNYLEPKVSRSGDITMSDDCTWRINKKIDKDVKIQSSAYCNEVLDTRELYIRVDAKNYILYENGQIAYIGKPAYPNELVWDHEF